MSELAQSQYATAQRTRGKGTSSSVSMCSLTKEMGTASSDLTPCWPSSLIASSVYGLSHSTCTAGSA